MSNTKVFEIHYDFEGRQISFTHRSALLSDAESWYLVCLYSGCGQFQGLPCSGAFRSVKDFAERYGITAVSWREVETAR